MSVRLLTEHDLEFLSLTGGCTGSSEPTLVKMPHRWKSHVTAHFGLHIMFFIDLENVLTEVHHHYFLWYCTGLIG